MPPTPPPCAPTLPPCHPVHTPPTNRPPSPSQVAAYPEFDGRGVAFLAEGDEEVCYVTRYMMRGTYHYYCCCCYYYCCCCYYYHYCCCYYYCCRCLRWFCRCAGVRLLLVVRLHIVRRLLACPVLCHGRH